MITTMLSVFLSLLFASAVTYVSGIWIDSNVCDGSFQIAYEAQYSSGRQGSSVARHSNITVFGDILATAGGMQYGGVVTVWKSTYDYSIGQSISEEVTSLADVVVDSPLSDAYFGVSVDLYSAPGSSDLFLAAGAHGEDLDESTFSTGAAYVFLFDYESETFVQLARLQPDTLTGNSGFGKDLSISNTKIAIAALDYTHESSYCGAVFIYSISGSTVEDYAFTLDEMVTPVTCSDADNFGHSIVLNRAGDKLYVGAETGTVEIVYTDGSWTQNAVLYTCDRSFCMLSVDLYEDESDATQKTLVIGEEGGGITLGYVHVFDYLSESLSWNKTQTLSDNVTGSQFGGSVAVSVDSIAVGQVRRYDGGIHVYGRTDSNDWERHTLIKSGLTSEYFGTSLDFASVFDERYTSENANVPQTLAAGGWRDVRFLVFACNSCTNTTCNSRGECTEVWPHVPIGDSDTYSGTNCSCETGFGGDYCEIDIDECASSPCAETATCFDAPGYINCSCAEGYTGEYCDEDYDECLSNPCDPGFNCVDNGYLSYNCTDIDECLSHSCNDRGNCSTPEVNMYQCDCEAIWEGTDCQLDVNSCTSTPCINNGWCEPNNIEYLNDVTDKWEYYPSYDCHYHDFCQDEPCGYGQECVNLGQGYYDCTGDIIPQSSTTAMPSTDTPTGVSTDYPSTVCSFPIGISTSSGPSSSDISSSTSSSDISSSTSSIPTSSDGSLISAASQVQHSALVLFSCVVTLVLGHKL